MDYKEFIKYIKQPESYDAYEVANLEIMSEEELDYYQGEEELDTGNLSRWDRVRAIITFRQKIEQLKLELGDALIDKHDLEVEVQYLKDLLKIYGHEVK